MIIDIPDVRDVIVGAIHTPHEGRRRRVITIKVHGNVLHKIILTGRDINDVYFVNGAGGEGI